MIVYDIYGNIRRSAYSVGGAALPAAYKIDGTRVQGDPFLSVAVVSSLPAYTTSGLFQGACTDGEYIYQIAFDSNAYTSGKFIKYKISDGTVTTKTFDGSVPYNHGNDMTYNPNNGHIYVAAMSSDGAVMELDTDFNYVTTHYLVGKNGSTYSVWSLCFDRIANCFYSENGGDGEAIYDQNLNYIEWRAMPTRPSSTAQGQETDGQYIYRVFYNPNTIEVCTVDGVFVISISLPLKNGSRTGEPETLMYNWSTGEYYTNCNFMSQLFYNLQIINSN